MTYYRTQSGFGEYLSIGAQETGEYTMRVPTSPLHPEGVAPCNLPAVFCRPGPMRDAQEEGVALIQWWRDLGTEGKLAGKVRELLEFTGKYIPTVEKWSTERATAVTQEGFAQLARLRQKLDGLKPVINKVGKDGNIIITNAEWAKQNKDWYVWVSAMAQGVTPTDAVSGRAIVPTDVGTIFGDRFPMTDSIDANYYDGLHFGRLYANEEEGTDLGLDLIAVEVDGVFGLTQAAVITIAVVVGISIVAFIYWLSSREISKRMGLLNERLAQVPPEDIATVLQAGGADTLGMPAGPGGDLAKAAKEGSNLLWTVAIVGALGFAAYTFGPQLIGAGKAYSTRRRAAAPA